MPQFSVAVRNAMLNAHEAAIGTSPKLRILTGSAPSSCADAETGTLLAELAMPSDWAADASSGSKAKLGSWTGAVIANGTAGYYRIVNTTGATCHEQGTIGTSGSDLNTARTSLTTGQVISVSAKTLTAGNA